RESNILGLVLSKQRHKDGRVGVAGESSKLDHSAPHSRHISEQRKIFPLAQNPRSILFGTIFEDSTDFSNLLGVHNCRTRFNDSSFSVGYFAERVAKDCGVVKTDGGKDADGSLDNVGCIPLTPHSDLDNCDLDW